MIDRRGLVLGATAMVTRLLPSPACGEELCAPVRRPAPKASDVFADAEADVAAGRVRIGGIPMRVASGRLPHSVTASGGDLSHLRFEVRTGERDAGDRLHASVVDRAEVVAERAGRVAYGTPFWWSFSMLVEDGPEIVGDWCLTGQLHQSGVHPEGNGRNPLFALCWHSDGASRFSIISRAAATAEATRPYVKPTMHYADDAYPRGVWVRWLFEFRFAWEGGAVLRAWRDGRPVIDRSGPDFRMGYEWDAAPDLGAYCQFGIYRASAAPGNPWKTPDAFPMVAHFADFDFTRTRPACLPPL